jgi:putative oxidoreductase
MNKYVAVLGRLLLAFLFLAQMFVLIKGISNPGGYEGYQAWLGAHGLPGVFAPLIILIQLIGGALLLLGFKTKLAAIVMAVYTVFLIVFIGAPDVPLLQYLAITGGLLVLAANPTMACSLDNLKK